MASDTYSLTFTAVVTTTRLQFLVKTVHMGGGPRNGNVSPLLDNDAVKWQLDHNESKTRKVSRKSDSFERDLARVKNKMLLVARWILGRLRLLSKVHTWPFDSTECLVIQRASACEFLFSDRHHNPFKVNDASPLEIVVNSLSRNWPGWHICPAGIRFRHICDSLLSFVIEAEVTFHSEDMALSVAIRECRVKQWKAKLLPEHQRIELTSAFHEKRPMVLLLERLQNLFAGTTHFVVEKPIRLTRKPTQTTPRSACPRP